MRPRFIISSLLAAALLLATVSATSAFAAHRGSRLRRDGGATLPTAASRSRHHGHQGRHAAATRKATHVCRASRRRSPEAHAASGPTEPGAQEVAGPVASGASWSADFSTGTFGQWSWWGQGQANIWGNIAVVNPACAGVPPLNRHNPHIAQMDVTRSGPAHGRLNAKLYKGFGYYRHGVSHEPANVSGTYSAWYYIPSSYKIRGSDWSNIFQFKEQYALPGGSDQSDPLWWVQLGSASWARKIAGAKWIGAKPRGAERPVAFLNHWDNKWTHRVVMEKVPLNRWFEISAKLHQGSRLVVSLDGKAFDTARASEYPVSPFHRTGNEWIFGVGNYATAPNTNLYIGGASFVARN